MVTAIFFFLAIVYFFLFVGELVYVKQQGIQIYMNILILVLLGLMYDNFIIA